MWNVIIGIVFIVGGLSGKLALIGTNSRPGPSRTRRPGLLAWGVVQMVRARQRRPN